MDIDAFMSSLGDARPPGGLSDTWVSLWWDRQGQWDRAHTTAQDIATVRGRAVHAYLHREEDVLWNADYWYRKAGRTRPDVALETEWEQLVREMLSCDTVS